MSQTGYTPLSLYYSATAAAAPVAGNLTFGELAININDGKLYYKDSSGVVKVIASAAGALGDVVGPASSTANAIPTFNGTTGKLIQNNSGVTISSGVLTATGLSAAQIDITAQGDLRLQDSTGGEYVGLQAPATLAASYLLTFPADDGTAGQALITDGSGVLSWSSAASGDVYGPASATDTAVALFDGTTGKLIKNSVMTIAADGATVISANSSSDGLRITQVGTGNAIVVEDSANPDATPFVVNASGQVGIGTLTPGVALQIANNTQAAAYLDTGANNSQISLRRSNTSVTAPTIVASGDDLGIISFQGYDGANQITAAWIRGSVDGAPGTNDMPGRLVFSTTADGASTPTERMRIDNAGRVGIGGTPVAGYTLRLNKAVTGATFAGSELIDATFQSDVTGGGYGVVSRATTAAAAFTLGGLYHFYANPQTIGAGSTITNQYGYFAESSLTSATNNYGFYGNIASGTGRFNFYAAGTADNYFAGKVGIGSVPTTSSVLNISKNVTGATTISSVDVSTAVQSDVTSGYNSYRTYLATQASAFTLASATHYLAAGGSAGDLGAGSSITTQRGFYATSALTGATNNYGFYSDIASGTGRFNFFANGTADNYFAGALGIGAIPYAGSNLRINKSITGSTASVGIVQDGTVLSDVTSIASVFYSGPSTQAAAFTLGQLRHYIADQGTIGAGSSITNQYGFIAQSSLTGATNNYGFFSNIASGTGRYNFYAAGTAENYMAGPLGIGTATSTTDVPLLITLTGSGANINGFRSNATIPATATGSFKAFQSVQTTAAAAFTLSNLTHFEAFQGTIGAGSTVTSQTGFYALANLTGATNNYGFRSDIAASTGRFNFYAGGTAANVFAGTTSIGGVVGSESLRVTPQASSVNYVNVLGGATGNGVNIYAQGANAAVGLYLVSQGAGFHTFITGWPSNAVQFNIAHTASAVNYLQATGNATGAPPSLTAQGSDVNINMYYGSKGTGSHLFTNGAGAQQFQIAPSASSVNYMQVSGAATGFNVTTNAAGSDTDIGLSWITKGARGHIFYTNGPAPATQFVVSATASAVNYLQVTGNATGGTPSFAVVGSDTNIGVSYYAKGLGAHYFNSNNVTQFVVGNTASAVNFLQVAGNSVGAAPYMSAQGSDTNINLGFLTKGTGNYDFWTGGNFTRQFAITHTASAVNYLNVTGGATGTATSFFAQGSDTNVGINYITKGNLGHFFYTGSYGSGVPQFAVSHTASAVNYLQVTGAATGASPVLSVQGSDTNAGVLFLSKGTGGFVFYTNSSLSNAQFYIAPVASAVNYVQASGAATTGAPQIAAQGSDTNIDLALTTKGTGNVRFGTLTANADAPITGYITIKDSAGNLRKLAVIA